MSGVFRALWSPQASLRAFKLAFLARNVVTSLTHHMSGEPRLSLSLFTLGFLRGLRVFSELATLFRPSRSPHFLGSFSFRVTPPSRHTHLLLRLPVCRSQPLVMFIFQRGSLWSPGWPHTRLQPTVGPSLRVSHPASAEILDATPVPRGTGSWYWSFTRYYVFMIS